MKAFVTGANGFVGSHLTRFLAEKGIETTAYILKGTDCNLLKTLYPSMKNVKIVEGNILDIEFLKNNIINNDVIFHLAGVIRGYNQKDFDKINLQGTRNIIRVCKEILPNLKRLVVISSLAAAGPGTPENPNTEDQIAGPILLDYYGISKYKMECVSKNNMDCIPITIVRPCTVLGPGDKVSLDLYKTVKMRLKTYIGGAQRYYSILDVEDLVEGLFQCAVNENAIGETFYFASKGIITWDSLHEIINCKIFNRKYGSLINIPMPKFIVKLAARILELIYGALNLPAPFINQSKILGAAAPGQVVCVDKAISLLDWKPKHTVVSTVFRQGKWFLKQGWI